jgi:hypothetical protein
MVRAKSSVPAPAAVSVARLDLCVQCACASVCASNVRVQGLRTKVLDRWIISPVQQQLPNDRRHPGVVKGTAAAHTLVHEIADPTATWAPDARPPRNLRVRV